MKLLKIFYIVLSAFVIAGAANIVFGAPILPVMAGVAAISCIPIPAFKGFASAFMILNNINEREVFRQAEVSLMSAFDNQIDPKAFKLTQGYLRSEVALVAGISNYRFNVLVGQSQGAAPFNTEKRLELQDSFVCSSIGFFVYAPASATDAEALPLTYPDPQVFTTTTSSDAQTLYNGSLSITVNNNVLVPAWDLFRHYYVPQTQSDVAAATPPPSARKNQQSGMDGFFPMEPNVVFVGSKNNNVQINLPAGLTTVLANSRAVLWFRGVLAQNTTVVV